MVQEVDQEKLCQRHFNSGILWFSLSWAIKLWFRKFFQLYVYKHKLTSNILEVKNNSISDVTNDASGSILADAEGDSSTSNTSSTPKFNNKRKWDDEHWIPRLIDNNNASKKLSQFKDMRFYSRKQKRKACLKWNSARQ